MKGTNDLVFGIRAGFSYFYVKTKEMQETIREIFLAIETYNNSQYVSYVWDFMEESNPEKVLEMLENLPSESIVIAKNFNWFISDKEDFDKGITSTLQSKEESFSSSENRKVLIIISDADFSNAIPKPLQKSFIEIEFPLPDKEQRKAVLEFFIESLKDNEKFKSPNESTKEKIIENAAGLTRAAFEKALSFSVLKSDGEIIPDQIFDLRKQEIEKIQGIKIGKYNQKLSDILGNDNAKELITSIVDHPDSKGFILVGPPGTGKSHLIKAIASEYGAIVFEAELANMMGSGLVGQAEQAVKEFCDLIIANPGCFVIFDEIEKGLPKKSQSGSDVAERSMSQILKLLSDRPVPFKAFATSNNVSSLPPEWLRAGRWDTAPICVDLPDDEEKKEILNHYKKQMQVKGDLVNMDGWSGAEIKEVCELARKTKKSINEVEKWIVPISKTMKEDIDSFRKWADGRTIPATIKKSVVRSKSNRSVNL